MEFILTQKAKEIIGFGGSYDIPEEREDLMGFAENIACADGFGYGLFDGGYIKPSDLIADEEQLKKLNAAVELVGEFKVLWENIAVEL